MTDLVKRLRDGLIEYPKRWSGDTHSDMGGSVDYEKNYALLDEAANRIEALEAKLEKAVRELKFIGCDDSLEGKHARATLAELTGGKDD